jgi:hypothetical protein
MIAGESLTTSSPSTTTGTSGCPLTASTGERSPGSTSIHSSARPLWPAASATRSTFVENGIR